MSEIEETLKHKEHIFLFISNFFDYWNPRITLSFILPVFIKRTWGIEMVAKAFFNEPKKIA